MKDNKEKDYVTWLNSQYKDIGLVYRADGTHPDKVSEKYKEIYKKCQEISKKKGGDVIVQNIDDKDKIKYISVKKRNRNFFTKEKGLSRLFLSQDFELPKEGKDFTFSKNIPSRLSIFIFGFLIFGGIFFGIKGMTGGVIGAINFSPEILGAVLFVGGVIGLFLFIKKK